MKKRAILSAALLLALPAAAAEVQVVEEIIVKVNGEIVTRSEIERRTAELRNELTRQNLTGAKLDQTVAERQKDILRDLVDESLLVQKAKELTINVDAAVVKRLDELRRQYNVATMEEFEKFVTEKSGMPYEDLRDQIKNQMLTERVIGQEVSHRVSVSKEEIQKYYEEHKQEFIRPEEVRLRQILISTEGKDAKEIPVLEKKAADVMARIKKGERFPELASKYSDDKDSAPAGGDIGFWKRGLLDKQIEDLVFNAKRGFVTDILKRPNGFLILKVEDRHQEGQATLADIEPEIQERLYMPKFQPAFRAYLTALRQNAFIEIRPGYIDSGAAPGQDTAWKDPENVKAAVTTKAELATKKKKKLLWVMPRPGRGKSKGSGDAVVAPAAPAPAAAAPTGDAAPKEADKPKQP